MEPNRNDSALERILNLGMALEYSRGMTAATIREQFYPEQTKDGARATFERDKAKLRRLGLVLEVTGEADNTVTRVDRARSFIDKVDLEPSEAAAVAMALRSALSDESFPAADALRSAIVRLSQELGDGTTGSVGSRITAESNPEDQGANLEVLLGAMQRGHAVQMHYTNADGSESDRTLETYGLHLLGGRWYAVGIDSQSGDLRTFTVRNMSSLTETTRRYSIPDDFNVRDSVALPFHYARYDEYVGASPREATLIIPKDETATAPHYTRGHGSLTCRDDGSVLWRVSYVDLDELCRFAIDRGYVFAPDSDTEREHLAAMLKRVEASLG